MIAEIELEQSAASSNGIYSILYTVSQQNLRTLTEFCVFDLPEKPKVQIYLRLHINKIIINSKRDEED